MTPAEQKAQGFAAYWDGRGYEKGENANPWSEFQVSIAAGDLVGKIYDALLKQYKSVTPFALHSLNVLCVRLVFCLYAEDSGVFPKKAQFHDYLAGCTAGQMKTALLELFRVLDQREEDRDSCLSHELAGFPFVNGGLFSYTDIEMPHFTDEIRTLILDKACKGFDWSKISPTIFGAVFESTLNPETRRSGGMHYTSVQNIHRVLDPLFLDDLRDELDRALKRPVAGGARTKALQAFRDRLSSLMILDPACGSGNFLTEAYLCLRRLENRVIEELMDEVVGQFSIGNIVGDEEVGIKVSIGQFAGIEINDFAVSVARTALWIAEHQMLLETQRIIHRTIDFLPLSTGAKIVEGNALRMDWENVVPKQDLTYIIGNPPFVGYSLQSKSQKQDILSVFVDETGKPYKKAGKIDYVSGWHFKAAQFIHGTSIRVAFVSTNSITQGEQVTSVWKPLYERFGIHIDFAYRTFRWDNEASIKAHVHCVIVSFSAVPNAKPKLLFFGKRFRAVGNINPYLLDAPTVFIESRSTPICNVPHMKTGNRPADGGHLIIEGDEYDEFVEKEPSSKKYIKKLVGSSEFINNKKRWCLWLVGVSPAELRKMPLVLERVEACKMDRENAPDEGRRKLSEIPALFRETNNPDKYIAVPATSSERRRYVPMGFLDSDTIATDAIFTIPDATLYHFGVLTSSVHMAWMRAVCGRLEMSYRYSKDVVYNNFPWPSPTSAQKARIEHTAQAILDARALYPDSSLADLYDELTMPPELRKAHQLNDRAVMQAYDLPIKGTSESDCVVFLMKKYEELTHK